jgi:hypothetical protein
MILPFNKAFQVEYNKFLHSKVVFVNGNLLHIIKILAGKGS